MKSRCSNPKSTGYKYYGGRGITVCERWIASFNNFLSDMGRKPTPDHSIERRNVNDGYSPENCFWLLRKYQNRNKRSNHMIEINGKTRSMAEWCEIYRISYFAVRSRIRGGWEPLKALSTAVGKVRTGPKDAAVITHKNKSMTIKQWARYLGIPEVTVRSRYGRGLPTRQVLSVKRFTSGRKPGSVPWNKGTSKQKQSSLAV